jgi:alpha-galactosidase
MSISTAMEGVWVTVPVSAPERPAPGKPPQAFVIARGPDGWSAISRTYLGDEELGAATEVDGQLWFGTSPFGSGPVTAFVSPDDEHGLLRIWFHSAPHVGDPSRVARRSSLEEFEAALAAAPPPARRRRQVLPELEDIPPTGSAPTPPLGWNSWNLFRDGVDDRAIREMADAIVDSGLRDAGYVYVNIDDGWQGHRDERGVLHPNEKFPDMRVLADYVHDRGLLFGIYSSPGSMTCAGYLGSHGHEEQDARTFAEWGVDLLKYDWCYAADVYSTRDEMHALYQLMGSALRATGRPIVYSLCQYGLHAVGEWGARVGASLWRTGGDTVEGDRWTAIDDRFTGNGVPDFQGPGRWNDADMMLVGLPGLTEDEARTHMTLWAISASPIILGHDVRRSDAATLDLLTNPEVLAVDQDPLGIQGRPAWRRDGTEAWTKALADGSTAVAVFNRGEEALEVGLAWADLGLAHVDEVRDLWARADVESIERGLAVSLPAHGSALFLVRG